MRLPKIVKVIGSKPPPGSAVPIKLAATFPIRIGGNSSVKGAFTANNVTKIGFQYGTLIQSRQV